MPATAPLAIVTSPRAAEIFYPDACLPRIVAALEGRGVPAKAVAWYADESWDHFGGAVLRSPWDLYWHRDAFLSWLERIGGRMPVANPVPVVRWAFDKRYLLTLAAAGVPTVPTSVFEDGAHLPEGQFVVKPALSGGGKDAGVFSSGQHAEAFAHAEGIRSRGGIPLAQPYLHDVDVVGERGLIYLNGQFSHAIAKTALLSRPDADVNVRVAGDVDAVHPNLTAHGPTDDERRVAEAALAALPTVPVFARIDLIAVRGQPTVLEVEAVDPDLFFALDDGAFDRYIDALVQWYTAARS